MDLYPQYEDRLDLQQTGLLLASQQLKELRNFRVDLTLDFRDREVFTTYKPRRVPTTSYKDIFLPMQGKFPTLKSVVVDTGFTVIGPYVLSPEGHQRPIEENIARVLIPEKKSQILGEENGMREAEEASSNSEETAPMKADGRKRKRVQTWRDDARDFLGWHPSSKPYRRD